MSFPSGDSERRLELTVPPGVDTGSVVRVSPDNDVEVLINIIVSRHPRFQRDGADLHVEIEVPFEDAILGSETDVQTLKGRVRLKIPVGSQNGQKIRLAGQGMPSLSAPQSRGDLFVILRPQLPSDLTEEAKDLLKQLKELRSRQE